MSRYVELIEKVKAAIEAVPWVDFYVNDSEGEARAAIAAVAEWLEDQPTPLSTDPYGCAVNFLLKQLEQPK